MARKNAIKVATAFLNGEVAIGDSKLTISTNGHVIWSYKMPIARINRPRRVVYLLEYSEAPSNTTRSQVRSCETVFNAYLPDGWEIMRTSRITTDPGADKQPEIRRRPQRAKLSRTTYQCDNCDDQVRSPGLCASCKNLAAEYFKKDVPDTDTRYNTPNPNRTPRFTTEPS